MADQADEMFSADQPENNDPSEDNSLEALLEEIKTEDGRQKYEDPVSALKSIAPAQEHIRKLETELAELRNKVTGQQDIDTVVNQLREEFAQANQNQASPTKDIDLASVIDERLQAKEVERRQMDNSNAVVAKFKDVYGDKAKEEFQKLADSNGIGLDFLHAMAKKSPDAVFRLAGIKGDAKPVAKTSGSINTEAFQPPSNQPTQPKSIMGGATTKDMIQAWRLAGESLNQS